MHSFFYFGQIIIVADYFFNFLYGELIFWKYKIKSDFSFKVISCDVSMLIHQDDANLSLIHTTYI